jgi:hypothetical protein
MTTATLIPESFSTGKIYTDSTNMPSRMGFSTTFGPVHLFISFFIEYIANRLR